MICSSDIHVNGQWSMDTCPRIDKNPCQNDHDRLGSWLSCIPQQVIVFSISISMLISFPMFKTCQTAFNYRDRLASAIQNTQLDSSLLGTPYVVLLYTVTNEVTMEEND